MSNEPGALPAQGWYPAPEGDGRLRYWDGTTWTEHYTDDSPAPPAAGTPRDADASHPDSDDSDRRLRELTRAADAALPPDLPREGPLADRDWDDLCRWKDQIDTARAAAAVLGQQARRVTQAKVAATILREYPTATEAYFDVEDVGDGSGRWAFTNPRILLAEGHLAEFTRAYDEEDDTYDEEWNELLQFDLSEWATSRDSRFTLNLRTGEWTWR